MLVAKFPLPGQIAIWLNETMNVAERQNNIHTLAFTRIRARARKDCHWIFWLTLLERKKSNSNSIQMFVFGGQADLSQYRGEILKCIWFWYIGREGGERENFEGKKSNNSFVLVKTGSTVILSNRSNIVFSLLGQRVFVSLKYVDAGGRIFEENSIIEAHDR